MIIGDHGVMIEPPELAPLASEVTASVLRRIDAGSLVAADWDIDGPRWNLEMKGRVTRFSHMLPSGTEIELRYRHGERCAYSDYEMLVLRNGAVLVEISSDDAKPVIDAVRALLTPQVAAWRRALSAELG